MCAHSMGVATVGRECFVDDVLHGFYLKYKSAVVVKSGLGAAFQTGDDIKYRKSTQVFGGSGRPTSTYKI